VTKPVRVDYDRIERHEFEIYKESILQRLDIYIHKRMPEYSRTLVQKLIKDGLITVNGRSSKPAYEINLGDKIVCELPKLIQPHVVATDIPLEIVHEDDHLIAINKPPQFVVHPAAGHWDASEPVILPPDATVAEALARVREAQLHPAVAAQVFVSRAPTATPTGRYLGVVHFQRLLREPPAELVGGLVDRGIDPLTPETTLSEITQRMAPYNLVGLAVVDDMDRLVGAVTVDDVLDHLLPHDWRDRDHADTKTAETAAAETHAAETAAAVAAIAADLGRRG
jgi:CBS domain-containing protein/ribosomal 50S subunit-recycling heat shock protein